MKRLICVLLCIVTCFACSLTAFAGGPITAEDIAAKNARDNSMAAAQSALPDDLSVGTTYCLASMMSDSELYMLNVWNKQDTDGAKVDMWKYDGSKEQRFRLISSGSYYKLEAIFSSTGRVLDAYRPLTNGCSVDLWSNDDDDAQQLVIEGDNNSGYVVKLAYDPTLVLTAVSLSNDGAVQFRTDTGAANQRWMFLESDDTLDRAPYPNAQNKSQWCWAAAAKIVASHNGGGLNPSIDTAPHKLTNTDGVRNPYYGYRDVNGIRTHYADGVQWEIVNHIKGNDKNTAGNTNDTPNAIRYAASNKNVEVERKGEPKIALSTTDIAKIQYELDHGRYVVGIGHSGEKGHAVVILGYNDELYQVYNPWNDERRDYTANEIFVDHGLNTGGVYYRIDCYTYCRPVN